MKWKLLLSVGLLAAAGCATTNQEAPPGLADLDISADLVPPPVEGITVADVDQVYGIAPPGRAQRAGATQP